MIRKIEPCPHFKQADKQRAGDTKGHQGLRDIMYTWRAFRMFLGWSESHIVTWYRGNISQMCSCHWGGPDVALHNIMLWNFCFCTFLPPNTPTPNTHIKPSTCLCSGTYLCSSSSHKLLDWVQEHNVTVLFSRSAAWFFIGSFWWEFPHHLDWIECENGPAQTQLSAAAALAPLAARTTLSSDMCHFSHVTFLVKLPSVWWLMYLLTSKTERSLQLFFYFP